METAAKIFFIRSIDLPQTKSAIAHLAWKLLRIRRMKLWEDIDTIDLTDKLKDWRRVRDWERDWERISTSHRVRLGTHNLSTLYFGPLRFEWGLDLVSHLGPRIMELRLVVEGKTHLVVEGKTLQIGRDFQIERIPIDPEVVYEALLASLLGKRSGIIRRERKVILQGWEDFISLFLPPAESDMPELTGYDQ